MAPSVLVVDDDFNIRAAVTDALVDEGFSVVTAADGREALDYLRANEPPELILLDWMMPRCNGEQFRAEHRSDPVLSMIPVVVLTADSAVRNRVMLEGHPSLEKPVCLDDLLDTVSKYCRAPLKTGS